MKFKVQTLQQSGHWLDHEDIVASFHMANAYAEWIYARYGTHNRVVSVREFEDDNERLLNKVCAYHGGESPSDLVDWFEFKSGGATFRVNASGDAILMQQGRGSTLWVRAAPTVDVLNAASKARYGH